VRIDWLGVWPLESPVSDRHYLGAHPSFLLADLIRPRR
jgi:hypothetical protein